ncbi:GLPGLI family protein [Chryseobacterium sp. Ch-15]|uniref:GLPGLI family protein n=1 Tax=Chryseobacterium muglaense TaxID=2893752 RepID=A0A9Q3UQH2_9FLAO|nr:GLPGLI family protein [Chryseobacterium muglaense]MBD3904168.1 GLPGLI family protein [Chryseobacterium muglaense]MCC9033259.1 GLPGLI family protein [Chryseobacterium muglaense]MCM2553754.1 GLPGLI family protein [Chryseobacterium muglaense]
MKTKLSILLLFITGLCFAQSNQFIYEYTFKMDSLNRDKSDTENMILQTSSKGSKFYSQVKAVYDSTMTAAFKDAQATQKTHFDFTNLKQSKVSTEVIKTYPDYKRTLKRSISSNRLLMVYDKKLNWEISKEKSKVLGYDVQMATTFLHGRKWKVWFATEIPIPDGPHEFYGLPGLIVKAEDSKGDHQFTLIATKKVAVDSDEMLSKKNKEIIIDEEKFRKLWGDYKKDPVKEMRQTSGSSSISAPVSVSSSITFDGKTYSQDDMLKLMEKERKDALKKTNNFLELDLYR